MEKKKVKTGIEGFDEVLKGGVNEGSSLLITGGPGTGKTIFALQFAIEGAKRNEPTVYITSEEDIDSIREYANSFGFDVEKYEEKKLIFLIKQSLSDKKLVSIATPLQLIKKYNIKRVVLDSLTLFEYSHTAGVMDYRKEVLEFILRMKEAKVTLVATSEKQTVNIDELSYSPEDFLFSGLVVLTKVRKFSSFERCLFVVKMRGQEHSLDVYPFAIGKNGITVYPGQLPFSLIEKDVKEEKFRK